MKQRWRLTRLLVGGGRYGELWGEDPYAELAALVELAQPGHSGVVEALDYFRDEQHGFLYLVLPLVPGQDLYYKLKETGAAGLPEDQARLYFRQVVEALHYMKKSSIKHGRSRLHGGTTSK
jgi:serine/threonine protein kinase